MAATIFSVQGCLRCKLIKEYMAGKGLAYEEHDALGEGKDVFRAFYKENRTHIFRGADGVEFPVYSDGEVVRQGLPMILAKLMHGSELEGYFRPGVLHGEWVDGVFISGGDPAQADKLLEVLGLIKEKNFRLEAETNGLNPEVLQKATDKALIDRLAFILPGPPEVYQALGLGQAGEAALAQSMALAARCPEYRFILELKPIPRSEGGLAYLTPEEAGQTAALVEKATGSKKHPFVVRALAPEKGQDVEPLAQAALFKYRTACRRYMVMADIEK